MDDVWERAIPLYRVQKSELSHLFYDFNRSQVMDYEAITIGCRNSNYIVTTNKGPYLLRICPANDHGYRNEIAAFKALQGVINIPELLAVKKLDETTCLIYEYIEGTSLQEQFMNRGVEEEVIVQVARRAAIIHNLKREAVSGLEELELPPFHTWYDLFLDNEVAGERLGSNIVKRIKRLVADHDEWLQQIDLYHSFIHCDFRPANMLIDKENNVFFVDWEFAGFGHTLADIGQFFRYSHLFNSKHLSLFAEAYNKITKTKLPENWYDLSQFRDLINPLQMIGSKGEAPERYKDLKAIITATLDYFKY